MQIERNATNSSAAPQRQGSLASSAYMIGGKRVRPSSRGFQSIAEIDDRFSSDLDDEQQEEEESKRVVPSSLVGCIKEEDVEESDSELSESVAKQSLPSKRQRTECQAAESESFASYKSVISDAKPKKTKGFPSVNESRLGPHSQNMSLGSIPEANSGRLTSNRKKEKKRSFGAVSTSKLGSIP